MIVCNTTTERTYAENYAVAYVKLQVSKVKVRKICTEKQEHIPNDRFKEITTPTQSSV